MKKLLIVFILGIFAGGVLIAAGSCTGEIPEEEQPRQERILLLELDQDTIVPTSILRIHLGGSGRMQAEQATVRVTGGVGGREVEEEFQLRAERDGDVGDLYVDLRVSDTLWPAFTPGDEAIFHGEVEVRLRDILGIAARGRLEGVNWRFVRQLKPMLTVESPSLVYANERIEVSGEGILRPREGQTWAVIESGQMMAEQGHIIELQGARIPVDWEGERTLGGLRLDPAVVGVQPGHLLANFYFENEFSDETSLVGSDGGELDCSLGTTFIASISPEAASRGQVVEIGGRGFVSAREGEPFGMLLRFEGVITAADPAKAPLSLQGESAVERIPFEVRSDRRIAQNIWYDIEDRQLGGLGATPGVFEGSITPIVFDEYGESVGISWVGTFEILPTKQMVYLKYLPAFSVALDRYGLFNVEREIRDRILEVVHRDYAGVNIAFEEEPPEDFVHYMTVELGGPDPADGYAFGYDNSFNDQPKDTGNLFLDDYLGGLNWSSGEQWNNPYGGIFVESFAFFSPRLHPENPYKSDHFDRIFGPFMPELGGSRVRATEWPGGGRAPEIAEAIRVFGNVVGNTLSHEAGHALGLAHYPEDWESPGHFYHNLEAEGCIMDAGVDRSFAQRAELDGEGPVGFSERNRDYLRVILPVEE